MVLEPFRKLVSRRPLGLIVGWGALALAIGVSAPSLTRLAAEGQANLLPKDAESNRMAELVAQAWPDQAYQAMAVVALHRASGLTSDDEAYARRLAERFERADRPKAVLSVLGPRSPAEVAQRMLSHDRTMQLLAVPLAPSFVSPTAHRAVAWLQKEAEALGGTRPSGLEELWTGDAVIGRDYMEDVQQSLNRAAVATIVLLLIVLLAVYRSIWLALVPLVTIAISLVVARGILAWLVTAGWEVSPLVELFLVVVLFGSGTDFCLLLAWRFGEHWKGNDPAATMGTTLRTAGAALVTSAATVIAGLSLMGVTRFKLFSSTGPSVALGLAITLAASLTLTPAMLVLLARHHPRAFGAMHSSAHGFWDKIGHKTLARPLATWLATLALMIAPAVLGLRTVYTQDLLSEMPPRTASVTALQQVGSKFGEGYLAPLTIVVETGTRGADLRQSEGLELIDEASRFLTQNRRLLEVRSATQPLGSTALLDPARISARLSEVDKGFGRMSEGASQLRDGLNQGVAKIRLAVMLESFIQENLPLGKPAASTPKPAQADPAKPLLSALTETAGRLGGAKAHVAGATKHAERSAANESEPTLKADPRAEMIRELTKAAEGAGQIAEGARRAQDEVSEILFDPVGRHSLDRLLITPKTIREHPELLESFAAYISPDGRVARIDVVQAERMNSEAAMNQVLDLRRRLGEYLGESHWLHVRAGATGPNAQSADVRALTRRDQQLTWLIVPLGVFLILLVALRDPWTCLNLVATMVLTYAFALGITHAVFVTGLGDPGLDWKVPYFLFVLLIAVGVDYNVFLMTRLQEEAETHGLRTGICRAVAATGGLITSAAMITACSFASLLLSPLSSLRQLGFALVVGVTVDAVLVRPVLVPCGHWLMKHKLEKRKHVAAVEPVEELEPMAV